MVSANNWEKVHQILAKRGIAIKPHGNGLVLQAYGNPKLNMKASAFDRSFSKSKLEQHFGAYRIPVLTRPHAQENYRARPLSNSPLFDEYMKLREEKRILSASIRQEKHERLQASKNKWAEQKTKILMMPLTKRDRFSLNAHIQQQEKAEKQKIIDEASRKQQALISRFPHKSWKEFYRHNKHREQIITKVQDKQQHVQPQQTIDKPVQRQQNQGMSR